MHDTYKECLHLGAHRAVGEARAQNRNGVGTCRPYLVLGHLVTYSVCGQCPFGRDTHLGWAQVRAPCLLSRVYRNCIGLYAHPRELHFL